MLNSSARQFTEKTPMSKYELEPKLFLAPNSKRKGEGGLRTKGYFKQSNIQKPLISVVTVVYNGELHIEQTIKSVIGQSYDNVEYIIIDGGSTDSTLDIIKKYESKIDYWVSESDQGIYDAMNKGGSLCTGEYIAFLNADDWYNNYSIQAVVNSLNNKSFDYIFGYVDYYQNELKIGKSPINTINYKISIPFAHPSLFLKRSILLQIPFNLNHPLLADYDLIIKLIQNNFSYTIINNLPIANYRLEGQSSTTNLSKHYFKIHYEYFGLTNAIYYNLVNKKNQLLYHILKWIRNEK